MEEIGPGLGVHALTFAMVGSQWLSHHNAWSRIFEISTKTLALNLLALFFVTLIPFGARIAAENPADGLGIGLVCACRALFGLANMAAAMSAPVARHTDDPAARVAVIRVRWIVLGFILVHLAAAGLCVLSPWFGYAVIPVGFLFQLLPAVRRLNTLGEKRGAGSEETSEPGLQNAL